MTGPVDEHERTMAFAEIALGQIRALRQPASPRHYEIWYCYATGHSPSLNQTINEMLARNGTLSDADVEQIYETYISAQRFTDRIDHVGSRVMGEIEEIMAMIGAAAGNATNFGENLAAVMERLGIAADEPAVRAIVESLVQATKDMEKNTKTLEERLQASKSEITQLQHNLELVRTESLTDPLTSLANRKYFEDALVQAVHDARAKGEQLSLLIADVDHFKRFNDNFGHLTGDQVLRLVAATIRQNVKGQDTAARFGGEEFAVILPKTALRAAMTVAEHIRRAMMTKEMLKRSTGEHLGRVTISIGTATLRANDTAQSLIERADTCLYAAKRGGRNRVVAEADPEVFNVGTAHKVA
jgi:diguanylate cyclase